MVEWEDAGDMEWEASGMDDEIIDTAEEPKPIKKMHLDDIRPSVLQKINQMKDLFELGVDDLVKIARHFRWNDEMMQTCWFEQKSKLELDLGIKYD
jgi:hypothetical protein